MADLFTPDFARLRRVPSPAGPVRRRTARMTPVLRLRIIKAEFNAMRAAGRRQRLKKVFAVGRRIHNIPVGYF